MAGGPSTPLTRQITPLRAPLPTVRGRRAGPGTGCALVRADTGAGVTLRSWDCQHSPSSSSRQWSHPPPNPLQLRVLFNPLCRVLCTLRSVYLCAISPIPVFSLATDTPRESSCTPKQIYSWMRAGPPARRGGARRSHGAVTLSRAPFQVTCWRPPAVLDRPPAPHPTWPQYSRRGG